jgi:CRP-like cAMP-binding protein
MIHQFYVIVDGSVTVTKKVHPQDGKGANSVVLEVLKHDMWFGEIGLLKDIVRMCTVTCTEDCLFLVVTRAKVCTIISSYHIDVA